MGFSYKRTIMNFDRFSEHRDTHLDTTDDPIEREAPELTPEEEMEGIYDNCTN